MTCPCNVRRCELCRRVHLADTAAWIALVSFLLAIASLVVAVSLAGCVRRGGTSVCPAPAPQLTSEPPAPATSSGGGQGGGCLPAGVRAP